MIRLALLPSDPAPWRQNLVQATPASASNAPTVARLVAEFLVARKVDRVFGLQGGHIQSTWDPLAQLGVRIVDVRDEDGAVHIAHAHALLTGGAGVCLATAGPGVTNCVTAIANAQLARVPVLLIGGCAPVPQDDLGPLLAIDQCRSLPSFHEEGSAEGRGWCGSR